MQFLIQGVSPFEELQFTVDTTIEDAIAKGKKMSQSFADDMDLIVHKYTGFGKKDLKPLKVSYIFTCAYLFKTKMCFNNYIDITLEQKLKIYSELLQTVKNFKTPIIG